MRLFDLLRAMWPMARLPKHEVDEVREGMASRFHTAPPAQSDLLALRDNRLTGGRRRPILQHISLDPALSRRNRQLLQETWK